MYAAHFGLREPPFAITPDPAYVYLSRHHQEALAHLLYGVGENGGFVQLTGEVGTGKTTLVRTLLEQRLENVDVALCLNPRLTVEELLAAVCDELGVSYPRESHTLKALLDPLNAHLLQTHAAGRRTVLILDEAQNLSREVLEQIRLLTNLETAKHKLLRIILVGQPELRIAAGATGLAATGPAHHRPLSPAAAGPAGNGRLYRPPAAGRGWARGFVHLGRATGGLPLLWRHPPVDQHPLRPRPARRLRSGRATGERQSGVLGGARGSAGRDERVELAPLAGAGYRTGRAGPDRSWPVAAARRSVPTARRARGSQASRSSRHGESANAPTARRRAAGLARPAEIDPRERGQSPPGWRPGGSRRQPTMAWHSASGSRTISCSVWRAAPTGRRCVATTARSCCG